MIVRFGWFGAFTTLMLVASSSVHAQPPSITDALYADRHVLNDAERGERQEIARLGQGSWEARTGRFLVASRGLKDLRFRESVILLVDHGTTGSMGVMINRPSDTTLSTILPDIEALENRSDVAYLGGPVGLREMLFLVRAEPAPADSTHVVGDIHVSSSTDLLATLAAATSTFRVFVGYAGWAAGQLAVEILRSDWHVVMADASTVFDMAAADVWPALIARAGQRVASADIPFRGPLR